MTETVPVDERIERVVVVTVDCLRWDYHDAYRELYPPGVWYRATPQATYTPTSHASLFTGLNPPRHGVYTFGDKYRGAETLLSTTDSASASGITQGDPLVYGLEPGENVEFEFGRWYPNCLDNSDDDSTHVPGPAEYRENVVQLGDYDLIFLHDWILHRTERGGGNWHENYLAERPNDPEYNHRQYRNQLELSRVAHEHLLSTMKEEGLYENTLFVVWGDHGQALAGEPFGRLNHSHFPEEAVGRVPIAFCSPLFETDAVDIATNARAVDVVPTLETILQSAGITMEEIPHEYEGVDLTRFDGELIGYTMSGQTAVTGFWDGVRTSRRAYLNAASPMLVWTDTDSDPDRGYRLQRRIDEPDVAARLQERYEEVRSARSRLIHRGFYEP